MAEAKTQITDVEPRDFIAGVEPQKKRDEALVLLEMFERVTGEKAQMWGPSIIGFGVYNTTYASGRDVTWMRSGFSPRKAKLSVYLMDGVERHANALAQMGPYTNGVSCLYLKSLDSIDEEVLSDVVRASVAYVREKLDKPEVATS